MSIDIEQFKRLYNDIGMDTFQKLWNQLPLLFEEFERQREVTESQLKELTQLNLILAKQGLEMDFLEAENKRLVEEREHLIGEIAILKGDFNHPLAKKLAKKIQW
jgi:hypothetical protein